MKTPEDVFTDFLARRKGILKALTTECALPRFALARLINLVPYVAFVKNATMAISNSCSTRWAALH